LLSLPGQEQAQQKQQKATEEDEQMQEGDFKNVTPTYKMPVRGNKGGPK